MTPELKVISYSDSLLGGKHLDTFIDDLMHQFTEFRCVILTDLPYNKNGLVEKAMSLNEALHAIPADVLSKYTPTMQGGLHKYNGDGWHHKYCEMNKDGEPISSRQFFTCLPPTPGGHPLYPHYFADKHIWPDEPGLSDFPSVMRDMMEISTSTFTNLIGMICMGLDYDFSPYRRGIKGGVLDWRAVRYDRHEDTSAIIEHKDNTILTTIVGADCDGLVIRAKSGEQIKIPSDPHQTVFMLGDAMQMSTSNTLEATDHSVFLEEDGRPHRHTFTGFFMGNASGIIPINGDRRENTLLQKYPDQEYLSFLDGCDLRWRDYVEKYLSGIHFYDQERHHSFG